MNEFEIKALRDCSIKAIEYLDTNPWDSKNNSRTGDLIYNGKLYPTKPILWEIQKQIENEKLNVKVPSLSGGEAIFKFFEKLGFEIRRKKVSGFEILIDKYIQILESKGEPNEKYKYDSIEIFQQNWDIDAPDFYEMFLNSLAKRSNLLFQNSWGFINLCAKFLPEKARELFRNLYDESISLEGRILNFQKESKNLVDEVKKLSYKQTLNHQQDERTIALYLAFRYPEKYILYKNDFYKSYCDEFDIKTEKVGKKFIHLNQIVDELIKSEVIYGEELGKIYRKHYPKPSWNDDRLMIQNILYVCYRKDNQYQKLIEILNTFDFDDLKNYYWFLNEIIEQFNLNENDKRLVFSFSERQINFTIGQRYAWNIRNINSKNYTFRAISTNKFSENFENFERPSDAYLNNFSDFKLLNLNKDKVINAIENELNRTKTSGYSRHNDESIEKLAFDIDFREHIFSQLDKNTSSNIDLAQISIKKMKNFPLNQILYGAPGTGKTYTTKKLAIEIIDDKIYDEEDRETILNRYDELVANNQIQFTTFHQSMSYEDFIEGIKPLEDSGDISYKVKDGLFTKIAKKAAEKIISKDNFEEVYSKLLNEIDNSEENKLVLETLIQAKEFTIYKNSKNNIKFHANTEKAYAGVIKKEILKHFLETGEALDWASYTKSLAQFMAEKFGYKQSSVSQTQKKYVLIIDEINRGNVSSIFGELITLLEEDKRKGNKEEIEVVLPYSQDKFSVPDNLYIIGTMNTADRSVESLDTALRRRFSFVEMPSKPEKLVDITLEDAEEIDLEQLLYKINQRIELLIDKDHQIGHSFFINLKDLNGLRTAFKNKIIPLLEEYFFGDFGKIGLVLGENFISVKNENNNSDILAKFSAYEEIDFITEKKVYQIKNCDELKAQDFISIYE